MNTQQNAIVTGHLFNRFSFQEGQDAFFNYPAKDGKLERRGGKVEKVRDNYVVVHDEVRNAFRTFDFRKMTPAS